MQRTIRSGNVIERSQYFVGIRKPRADRRKGSSSLLKIEQNLKGAVRQLARTLNCNCAPSWIFITLTYADGHLPSSPEAAAKQCGLFLRRLIRMGVDCSGVWITADKDKKGHSERLHHHLVLAGSGVDLLSEMEAYAGGRSLDAIWSKGGVHVEHLREQQDYTPLASYLVRQAASAPDMKKWHSSRNLKKLVLEEEKIVATAKELRAPCGAEVLEVGAFDFFTGSHYIRYIRPERKKREGWREDDPKPVPGFINHYGLPGYELPPVVYKKIKKLIEQYAAGKKAPTLTTAFIVLPPATVKGFEEKMLAGELFTARGSHRKWLPAYMYQAAFLAGVKNE